MIHSTKKGPFASMGVNFMTPFRHSVWHSEDKTIWAEVSSGHFLGELYVAITWRTSNGAEVIDPPIPQGPQPEGSTVLQVIKQLKELEL